MQLNPATGVKRRLGGTVFTVHPDGKRLLSYNLIASRRVGQCAMLSRREDILSDYLAQLSGKLMPSLNGEPSDGRSVSRSWQS